MTDSHDHPMPIAPPAVTPPPPTAAFAAPNPAAPEPAPPPATTVHEPVAHGDGPDGCFTLPVKAQRLPGPDVVRAVAILGVVVMNYHGYLILNGARRNGNWVYSFFDPWTGPLSTRFAATFVVTAGVGVSLLTRRAAADPSLVSDVSWRLARRGLLLYGGGLLFDFIWPGTILPYYGAMFVLATFLWRFPAWALAVIGSAAAIAGWQIHQWVIDQQLADHDVSWLTDPGARSPRGLLFNVMINGTHPLLPWLAFFCAGIVLGRSAQQARTLRIAFASGVSLFIVATALALAGSSDPDLSITLSPHPFDRSLVYTASALGTALVAFVVINVLSNRYADSTAVDSLRRAGQLSLTIYLAHAFVFNVLVLQLGWVRPQGIAGALGFALVFWLSALSAAIAFQRRFGRGPAEWLYRKLTA